MTEIDKAKLCGVIKSSIISFCLKENSFQTELKIDGLLGLTIDKKDIILISLKETIENDLPSFQNNIVKSEAIDSKINICHQSIFPSSRRKRKPSKVVKNFIPTTSEKLDEDHRIADTNNSQNLQDPSSVLTQENNVGGVENFGFLGKLDNSVDFEPPDIKIHPLPPPVPFVSASLPEPLLWNDVSTNHSLLPGITDIASNLRKIFDRKSAKEVNAFLCF